MNCSLVLVFRGGLDNYIVNVPKFVGEDGAAEKVVNTFMDVKSGGVEALSYLLG